MATGINTPTTADVHIREVWSKEILAARQFKLILAAWINNNWTKELQGWGDTIRVGRTPNIEIATKTPGSTWSPYVYTDTQETITVNKYEVSGYQVEEMTRVLQNPSAEEELQRSIGYSLGLGVETNIVNLFQSFSQTVGAAGVPISWSNLTRARQYLVDAGVTEPSAAFISPAAQNELLQLDQFTNTLYRGEKGPTAIEQAKLATTLGFDFYEVPYLRSAAAGQHDNAIMCKCTIALVMAKTPKIFNDFVSTDLATVVGAYQVYGVKEMDRYSPTRGNITATDEDAVLVYGP